jgi:N-acetylglucosamine-6-phosphate deacetylase
VPGFIDAQVNGGGGALFNREPTAEAIARIGAAHACFGTTAFLPTVISDSYDVMARAADAIAAALRTGQPGVLGVHFEGPHLSLAKRGVHAPQAIRPLGDPELALFARTDLGVRLVTLAPEAVSPDDIRRLVSLGVQVCLGHSNADFATTKRALEAGASGFTHLYNAMSPLTAREPGMVGAALVDPDSWCGLILDGCHVHDASARLALRAKGPGKVVWVTDAMSPVGTDEETFDLYGERVTRRGLELRDARGALAGSVLDMATAVQNGVRRLSLPLEESLRMASRYPAERLRLGPEYGRIAVGARADLVLIDDDVNVQATFIAGELVMCLK